jgi:phage terminase small subunit
MEILIEIWGTYQKFIVGIVLIIIFYKLYKTLNSLDSDNTKDLKILNKRIIDNHKEVIQLVNQNHKKLEDKVEKELKDTLKEIKDNTNLDTLEEMLNVIIEDKVKDMENVLSSRLDLSLHSIMERLFKENNLNVIIEQLLDKHLGKTLEERLKDNIGNNNPNGNKQNHSQKFKFD